MSIQRNLYIIGICCLLLLLAVSATNCSKDYSYEGGPVNDTTIIEDSNSAPSFYIPVCPSCTSANELKPNTWMFTINGTVVCGNVTRGVRSIEGTALTFFGPSACSQDTGLIITAYFTAPGLSAFAANLSAERVALEYYDKVRPSKIAEAPFTSQFSLIIQTYNQQSGEAIGTFSGQALTVLAEPITIANGKFNIKIE